MADLRFSAFSYRRSVKRDSFYFKKSYSIEESGYRNNICIRPVCVCVCVCDTETESRYRCQLSRECQKKRRSTIIITLLGKG